MAPRKKYAEPVKHEDLLDDAMKAAIRKQAQEEILKAQKAEAAKEYLAKCKEEELAASEPELAVVDILIDVPGYTKYIMVDGRTFNQGDVATVTKQEADSMRETISNSWRHERSNGGAHMKEYMAPKQDAVSAMSGSSMHKLARV